MSSTIFLDALKKYKLEQYYPSLVSQGMSSLNSLAELTVEDTTKLGVRSIDDKKQFLNLAREVKSQLQPLSEKRPLSATTTTTTTISSSTNAITPPLRKRPALASRTPPEQPNARRKTIGPHSFTSGHPSPTRVTKTADRRQSILPPRRDLSSQKAAVKNSTTKSTTTAIATAAPTGVSPLRSPLRSHDDEDTPAKVSPARKHLNVYGMPVTPPKRRLSMAPPQNTSQTLEEYLRSKNKAPQPPPPPPQPTAMSTNSDLNQRIRVCVRKRPLSKRELRAGESDIAPVAGRRTILINAPKTKVDLTRYTDQHSFTFDDVFDENISNDDIYRRTAYPLVDYIFSGGKATCFAYGQTGSGKTYTMLDVHHGLYVRAAHDIFDMLSQPRHQHLSAWIGFYEIYQGQLYDLLNQRHRLIPRDDGHSNVVIAGLREFPINDVERLMEVFEFGNQARSTGKTGANNNSSRSHAVLQVLLKTKKNNTIHGKLSFIDLAGSERGADRGDANSKARMEGAEINKSLLALKECIRALDQDQRHTPFRGSKLTQVLRDSFVGNSRTCMIATISPNNSNSEHTLNTLRYADRVKELKGESDPRLQAGQVAPFYHDDSPDYDEENKDETQSNGGYSEMGVWENDQAENLLEVDFPMEASNHALGTPQAHQRQEMQAPQKQDHYMRRLSSPPEDIYHSATEDPFSSTPVGTHEVEDTSRKADTQNTSTITTRSTSFSGVMHEPTVEHIRDFIKLHRAQIKELEECTRLEKKMIAKLSLTVSSHADFQEETANKATLADDHNKIVQLYEDYLNELEDILERKSACVETLGEQVKSELGDEEDDGDRGQSSYE